MGDIVNIYNKQMYPQKRKKKPYAKIEHTLPKKFEYNVYFFKHISYIQRCFFHAVINLLVLFHLKLVASSKNSFVIADILL